jgi:DNA invertase Pin-like site-specific DNA recombinase
MDTSNTMVPAHLLKMEVEDNKRLRAELEAAKRENKCLNELLVGLHDGAIAVDKMGNYVRSIKHKHFKPAYKDEASIEAIVTIIHDEGIIKLNRIAEKLEVGYSTILRRLKSNGLYPIEKSKIQIYYDSFCQE